MYDLEFVRKRRRRRIAAFVSLVSAIGITSLVIVSYLGRRAGSFTVSLANTTVKLALSQDKSFTDSTSHLLVDITDPFEEYTFSNIEAKDFTLIDSDKTPYDYGKSESEVSGQLVKTLSFFKYTFFVKNVGAKPAEFHTRMLISQKSWSLDNEARYLDDTLRVMIFENRVIDGEEEKHDYKIYAKSSYEYNFDKDGNKTSREFISVYDKNTNKEDAEGKYRLVDAEFNGSTVAESAVENFMSNDLVRYTMVMWLEGADPDSRNDKEPPKGASLKLAVEITAKEN